MGTDINGWVDLDAFQHWWDMCHSEEPVDYNNLAKLTRADEAANSNRKRLERCIDGEHQLQKSLDQLEKRLAAKGEAFKVRMAALKECLGK